MSGLLLRNIVKNFGSVHVLQGLSIDIAPGSVVAFVGDNGAGKSTLLRLIAGNLKPDSGEIYLGDTLLSALAQNDIRNAGIEMVFQDLALAPQQDIITNIFLGREICGPFGVLDRRAMKMQAEKVLSRLGITLPSLSMPVGKLSGGQQQAVAVARSLLFDPKILILDEPTAALAAREVDMVLSIIREQKKRGLTVILVSHRLNDVLAVADRIITLKHGAVFRDRAMPGPTLAQIVEDIIS